MFAVSAHDGTGLDELRAGVRALAEAARQAEREDPAAFRLPVQRSFALHGAGTVATGVCAAGAVTEGDTVEVQPGGMRSRVPPGAWPRPTRYAGRPGPAHRAQPA